MKKSIIDNFLKGFVLLFLLTSLVVVTSCEEDDPVSDEVILLSFGPSGVKHGDEITFIGENLDKVTSIVFKPSVEVTSDAFNSQSSAILKVTVPQAAEAGKILLKTPKGDIESLSILNFEVPVTINSITAEAKPGTNITITGEKINWIERVTFASDVVVEKVEFMSQSMTEMVVQVPMEAQSGFLIFATGGTEPLTFGSEEQLEVTLPVVSSISPTSIRHTGNLTIAGTDLDLVTSVIFNPDTVTEFVSQSASQIVVMVPATTEDGTLTLTQASPVNIVTSETLAVILPKVTSVSPIPAVPGEDDLTITGTDLDLIEELTFAGAGSVSSFISHTETEIVVAVPDGAGLGPIGYVSIHGYEAGLGAVLIIPSDGPPPLIVPLYEDAITTLGGEGGGWSSTSDFASTENAREGSASIKVTYTGDWGGGAQIGTWGQSPIPVSGTQVLAFSIFGTEGTGGQSIQVLVKDEASAEYAYMVEIEAGAWKDVEIPLTELGNMTQFSEIFFQNTDEWQGTVFIDRIGFSMAGAPPTLVVVMYDDASTDLVGQGGGWGGATTDWANAENARQGSNAIKATFAGGWGGAAQFGTWDLSPISVAGTTVFAFSVFGADVADTNIQVLIKDGGGAEYSRQIAVTGGEWQDVEIPLSELGTFTEVSEVFFQDTDWSGTVYIDYVGFR